MEGFVEGCLERIGEDDPDEEGFLGVIWEEGDDRGFVLEPGLTEGFSDGVGGLAPLPGSMWE